jgi:molecular chaperone DnaK
MQKEAELHADEDRKAKEAIEIRNNADNLAYQCEKQLKELGDKIDGAKKAEIEKEIERVREALKGNDTESIKTAYTDLQNKFQSVSEELYKQAAAGASAGAGAAGAGPGPGAESSGADAGGGSGRSAEGDVVDAEFEVVDDDKKK